MIIYILLTLVAIYFLFPFIYMFLSAFKTEAEAVAYPPSLFPKNWNWSNFVDAWQAQPFGKFFLNSVTVTVLSAVGSMVSAALKPSLILVGVLNMLAAWNDYLGPLIFLQDREKYTLALGLASFKGVHSEQIVPMLCITCIMIIPPILIFLFAQKYIVEGTSGSIK